MLGRLGGDLGEHSLDLLDLLYVALLGKSQPHAIERVGEPRLLDRLHQIIDRLCLEREDRVVRISGDEAEERRFDIHHPLNHRKTHENIGRATCRERVIEYVMKLVVGDKLKKKIRVPIKEKK